MTYYIHQENEVLVIEVIDWTIKFTDIKFTNGIFEDSCISHLQDVLWKWHVIASELQDFSQNDLSGVRNFIDLQLSSLDFFIAGYAIRRLCLDNDIQSGEVGRIMFRDYVLSLERECNANALNLGANITDGASLQYTLFGMSFPMRVLKVRNYLLHIKRLIDIALGHVQAYDLPLMARDVS